MQRNNNLNYKFIIKLQVDNKIKKIKKIYAVGLHLIQYKISIYKLIIKCKNNNKKIKYFTKILLFITR